MSESGERGPETPFLVALMRQGAPVLATTPDEMPDEVDDPTPVPAARRMKALAATDGAAPRDPLMVRATRYAVLLPLAYRIFLLPVVGVWLLVAHGWAPVGVAVVVAVLGLLANLLAALWVLRVPDRRGRLTRLLLYGDLVFALLTNVLVSAMVSSALYADATWVPWIYLSGTVALWTVCRGVPWGLLVVALSVPLQVLMLLVAELPSFGAAELAGALGGTGALVAALVTAVGALLLIGLGTRLALAIGLRRGRAVERAASDRTTHDTVLQVLEAMAMTTAEDVLSPADQLAKVRGMARAQANDLRRGLDSSQDDAAPDGLGEELAALATEMARDGLRAQLVMADLDDDLLSEVRRIAVRDAVREALRNTLKHAGTRQVVVRLEERDGGVAVIARDHGVGYDEHERPPGFGVSNSMKARLAEVGGHCTLESRPGHGTKVTLWVPR
ncbi:sensor histidine kinase [Amycolatopsis nigrescens]|uniref:sensor histidine kinase n=1 Tax=Amycolatopsis nigrescens TaxID=381445 RepID=UPI00036AD464|nr:ATP-binding protein [Amycolatopsis nigrescens]